MATGKLVAEELRKAKYCDQCGEPVHKCVCTPSWRERMAAKVERLDQPPSPKKVLLGGG